MSVYSSWLCRPTLMSNWSFVQSFSFSVCLQKKQTNNRPVSRADPCWHVHHTPQWPKKCTSFFLKQLWQSWPFQNLSQRCQMYYDQQWWLAPSVPGISGVIIRTSPPRPLLRTTSPGPARAYLVILWPLSLFGWWTDWLLLKIAARADQISQHFVHRGLMKVGGVTNPSSACSDTPVVKVCLSGWWSHCVSFRGTSVATSDNTSQTTSTMCN